MEKNTLEYSIDNGKTWILVVPDNESLSLNVKAGDEVLFRGGGFESRYNDNCYCFGIDGYFDVEGNIMSMEYGDDFYNKTTIDNNAFLSLFQNNDGLISAENLVLPATTLANNCYSFMFAGCTSLTTAPELPATTLSDWCYSYMFRDCTGLITAPELPATALASSCYFRMFNGCTSLNYIKCLATNISATDCTTNWVYNVASSGTFVKNSNMSDWTTGTSGIPNGWTIQDETS